MNDFARIMLVLSKDEFFALKDTAQKEYRHPRDQARYILRRVLLSEQSSPINDNSTGVRQDKAGAAMEVSQ